MDINQTAEYLGFKVEQVRWLRRTRKIQSGKILSKVFFRKQDLDRFIEAQFAEK